MCPFRSIVITVRQMLGLAVLTLGLLVAMATLPGQSLAAPPVALSGAYTGPANVNGLKEFGVWSGAPASVALDYLGNTGWNDIDQPSWALDAWQPYHASGGTLVLSVPMLVDSPSGSFEDGANGAYDQYYEALGQQLVADGYTHEILRIGWEFNGTWFPWSVSPSTGSMDATEFIADWRHMVDLFRAIPGGNFSFDWTVNPGPSDVPAADSYPGDSYVDYVGVDVYDSSWDANGNPITDPTARWNEIANQDYGLNWWLAFARSHDKPITIPEWGLNLVSSSNGAGDDPSFIQDMYDWMVTNQPAYETYFDYDGSVLDTSADPNATAEYALLFGDHTVASSPVTTPATPVTAPSSPVTAPSSPVLAPLSPVLAPISPTLVNSQPVLTPGTPATTSSRPASTSSQTGVNTVTTTHKAKTKTKHPAKTKPAAKTKHKVKAKHVRKHRATSKAKRHVAAKRHG